MVKRVDMFDHDTRDKHASKGDFKKIKDKQSYHI